MSHIPFIQAHEVEHKLSWKAVSDAMIAGHKQPRADIDDILFKQGENALLNRAAWISGAGIGIKTATIFPDNLPDLPSIHAVFTLFDDQTGVPTALIDGIMVTKWKTAGDSILGTRLLARKDSKTVTIIGAGAVAESLIDAYREVWSDLERIILWNRSFEKAEVLAKKKDVEAMEDLEQALKLADIVSSATMSVEPVIPGDWIMPGTHVDLIGAYRPDMREADDRLLQKASLFVDARETTLHDIGELLIPLNNGVIREEDVKADLYDLCNGAIARTSDDEITVFKNGGGAHLDLMTALYIQSEYQKT
ncbi:NAD(P)-binding domain-containing protein [Terasakiella sp. A23]|uniref:ornithine cyclodeaminase family protein n=1 Tax=Terasakiella sp. FCG-A23 TaxID=3080561 RepID=UPI002955AF50|nr:Gfo/Idh/MocA family oxidoreductase [Terasakiella sp. A23]MDV7341244.1 NAD(P)-binding domain-containing protein [Terasakiella sp. A23]